jgi:hypothetical protein
VAARDRQRRDVAVHRVGRVLLPAWVWVWLGVSGQGGGRRIAHAAWCWF